MIAVVLVLTLVVLVLGIILLHSRRSGPQEPFAVGPIPQQLEIHRLADDARSQMINVVLEARLAAEARALAEPDWSGK